MRRLAALIISAYQRTISPDHGLLRVVWPAGVCRFQPTCSEYTKAAIVRHGLVAGTRQGLRRMRSCGGPA